MSAPGRWPAGSTPRCWDETDDAQKAVGWFPFVLDTNGNGKLDEFSEPGKPEEGKDMRYQSAAPAPTR